MFCCAACRVAAGGLSAPRVGPAAAPPEDIFPKKKAL